jgi:hypothetical protein
MLPKATGRRQNTQTDTYRYICNTNRPRLSAVALCQSDVISEQPLLLSRGERQAGPSGDVLVAPARTAQASGRRRRSQRPGGIEAIAFGDIVFLVAPYSAAEQIGRDYGKALATKPLIVDVSNPSASRGSCQSMLRRHAPVKPRLPPFARD